MSVKSKSKTKLKMAEEIESDFKNRIIKEYLIVLREMEKELAVLTGKMKDGVLTRTEMNRYNRTPKLIKQLEKELKTIQVTKQNVFDGYMRSQYDFNYSYTAFINEGEFQTKLNYTQPSKNKVDLAIKNDFNKIALENNRSKVIEQIRSSITQSIAKGETLTQASARLKAALEQNANNAFRIVQTETTRIIGEADQQSMQHAVNQGLELEKEWVTTRDGKERDSHLALDGQIVPVDKPFIIPSGENNAGAEAMNPGGFGIAEEDINCRCIIVSKIKGFKSAAEFRKSIDKSGKNEDIESKDFDKWKRDRYN